MPSESSAGEAGKLGKGGLSLVVNVVTLDISDCAFRIMSFGHGRSQEVVLSGWLPIISCVRCMPCASVTEKITHLEIQGDTESRIQDSGSVPGSLGFSILGARGVIVTTTP